MADKQWYYAVGNDRKGPVPEPELRGLLTAGKIDGATPVWSEGMTDWARAEAVFGVQPPPLPGAVPPPLRAVKTVPNVPWTAAQAPARDYYEDVGMITAVARFFGRYFDFSGRSNRGEYWWWMLANILIGIAIGYVDAETRGPIFAHGPGMMQDNMGPLASLWTFVTFIPGIALGVRRLHDIDRSGWWLLLILVPLIGWLVLFVWACQKGTATANRFG